MASPQLDNIGLALQGFSAGLGGQLPQFQQAQNQKIGLEQNAQQMQYAQQVDQQERQQAAAVERQKTMFTDANAALQLLDSGNYKAVVQLGINRLTGLKQLSQMDPSIDPSDTQRVTQLAIAASKDGPEAEEARELLRGELEGTVQMGQALGILKPPEEKEGFSLSPGQVRFDASGAQIASVDKPSEEYEIISPQEAAMLGLPTDKQFQRNTATKQISQVGSGPAVQVNTGTATEGERTAGILANRLDFAQSQINDILASAPGAESPEMVPTVLSTLGLDYLSRVSNPAERQVIEAAQDDMLDAALTLGTGAAYTETQFKAYKRSYFPQIGDDQKTIEAKAKRLTNLLDAAYAKAGRGAPPVKRSDEPPVINSAVSTTPQPDNNDPLGLFTPSPR